jgi:hypothetical protein
MKTEMSQDGRVFGQKSSKEYTFISFVGPEGCGLLFIVFGENDSVIPEYYQKKSFVLSYCPGDLSLPNVKCSISHYILMIYFYVIIINALSLDLVRNKERNYS